MKIQRVWMLVLFQNCMYEGTGGCKNHLLSLYLRVGEHVSLEDTSCCTGVVALFASKRLHCDRHVHFQMIISDG